MTSTAEPRPTLQLYLLSSVPHPLHVCSCARVYMCVFCVYVCVCMYVLRLLECDPRHDNKSHRRSVQSVTLGATLKVTVLGP